MIPLQPKKPAPTIAKPQVSRPPSEQPRTAPLTTSVSRPPSGPIPKTPLVSRPPVPVKPSVPLPGQPKFMGEAPAAMKKGGYVTKDGRLNLGSGRVSTAATNKKSPNF